VNQQVGNVTTLTASDQPHEIHVVAQSSDIEIGWLFRHLIYFWAGTIPVEILVLVDWHRFEFQIVNQVIEYRVHRHPQTL